MGSSDKRLCRLNDEIQKMLSQIMYRDIKQEMLTLVTISRVKISSDLSVAYVYYTVLGNNKDKCKEVEKLLKINTKSLRMHLSKKMRTRTVPELKFFYDDTLDNAFRIEELLNSVKKDLENPDSIPEESTDVTDTVDKE